MTYQELAFQLLLAWPTTWDESNPELRRGWLAGVRQIESKLFDAQFSDVELARKFYFEGYCRTLHFNDNDWTNQQKEWFTELVRVMRTLVSSKGTDTMSRKKSFAPPEENHEKNESEGDLTTEPSELEGIESLPDEVEAPDPGPPTKCEICGELFIGTSTDHAFAKHR